MHITVSNSAELGAQPWMAKTRPHRRPVLAGVHIHPSRTRRFAVPAWVDDAWLEQRNLVAALQARRPDLILSHLSAARFYGWPVPEQPSWHPVSVTPRRTGTRIPGFRCHRAKSLEERSRFGITIATEAEVLRQISGTLSERELVVVADALCGPWSGRTDGAITPELVGERVLRAPRFSGNRRLQRALALARVGVGSPPETELRLRLIDAGLPSPIVGHTIATSVGDLHPDLAYPVWRIALEYEGDHHRVSGSQWDHDITRERLIRRAGWEYLRVTARMSEAYVVGMVREALAERGAIRL